MWPVLSAERRRSDDASGKRVLIDSRHMWTAGGELARQVALNQQLSRGRPAVTDERDRSATDSVYSISWS